MSVARQQESQGDGDVSNCVSNLIHAFANGLDIFKRLRERRRRKRRSKHKPQPDPDPTSGAEVELSNSLRRGPVEIQSSYQDHYSKAGDRFATGDAIAHASLAETLIKLNTGLVGIIAAFLNNDPKSRHLDLDYRSLTNLSNASRANAIDSLNQLYQRVGQSQLHVYRVGGCPRCGSLTHQNCSGGVGSAAGSTTKRGRAPQEKRKHTSRTRSRSNTPTIARVPIKSSNQTQLVVMRPRNTRKGSASSSSSSSSTKSQSTALSSPYSSPLASPLPQYSPMDPFPPFSPPPAPPESKNATIPRRRINSIDGPRPTTWPHARPALSSPPPPPPPKTRPQRTPPPREKPTASPGIGSLSPRRRIDKTTPSTFTFASDSTKLGEIPQRNWTTPFDYAEAERLNTEALTNGYPPATPEVKEKKKKGLFGFLRRGSEAS